MNAPRNIGLKEDFLELAERHLTYITSDPSLNLNSRIQSRKKALEFYATILTDLGLEETIPVLYEIEQRTLKPITSEREQTDYNLREILGTLGIKNQVNIFEVLQLPQVNYDISRVDRIDFLVKGRNLPEVIAYLGRNVDYTILSGGSQ